MATIVVTVVIVILVLYFLSEDLMVAFFPGIFLGLIIGFVLSLAVTTANVVTVETVEILPLHNLYDDVRIEGGFFVGSGKVSEVDYYFFNVVKENGGYYPERLRKYSEDITIFEDEQSSPYIEKTCKIRQLDKESVWVISDYYDNSSPFGCSYDFHIPTDSVDSSYSLR